MRDIRQDFGIITIMRKKRAVSDTFRLVKEIAREQLDLTWDMLEAFLFSYGSSKALARNLGMKDRKYYSSMRSLEKHKYIKRVNEDQFLITPKAVTKLAEDRIIKSRWQADDWDGYWRIVAFDIPEAKRQERDSFRSLIKRKGFVGIQNSVFIAPFADLEQLANLRSYLGIEKYISFFMAKSAPTDDDSPLKGKFGLK